MEEDFKTEEKIEVLEQPAKIKSKKSKTSAISTE